MAITVKCSSCKSKYQVRDTLAGQSIVCKECGESIVVPASLSVSAGAAPAKAYAVKGAGGKTARPVAPQKLSNEPAERVLPRGVAPSSGRARSPGNQQVLWICGGAAAAVLVAVGLIVDSVGPVP